MNPCVRILKRYLRYQKYQKIVHIPNKTKMWYPTKCCTSHCPGQGRILTTCVCSPENLESRTLNAPRTQPRTDGCHHHAVSYSRGNHDRRLVPPGSPFGC